MNEHCIVTFLYKQGDLVQWAGTTWRISQRRYTERDVMGPVHEYGLIREGWAPYSNGLTWALEPDVLPAEETAP